LLTSCAVLMAADQRRNRLNGASLEGCSSWEPYRTKKKKKSKHDLNAKSLISLEWDGNRKKVIAKREQIGISQRDLRPFIDSVPQYHNLLADAFPVPREIFELKNLTEVLSNEVTITYYYYYYYYLLLLYIHIFSCLFNCFIPLCGT